MPERIGQPADQPSPHAYPTAPLNAGAQQALTRLELRLTYPLDVVRAVTRHETAAVHAAQLAARAETDGTLSDLDADDLAHAEDLMAGAHTVLANAGRLDLIGAGA